MLEIILPLGPILIAVAQLKWFTLYKYWLLLLLSLLLLSLLLSLLLLLLLLVILVPPC